MASQGEGFAEEVKQGRDAQSAPAASLAMVMERMQGLAVSRKPLAMQRSGRVAERAEATNHFYRLQASSFLDAHTLLCALLPVVWAPRQYPLRRRFGLV